MGKIAVIADAGRLQMKIENILLKCGLSEMEAVRPFNHSIPDIPGIFGNVSLIIIDLNLRGADAIETILRIRQRISRSEIPILALTNGSSVAILKKAIGAGCSDFVLNPFDEETLVLKAYKLLGMADNKQPGIKPPAAPYEASGQEPPALLWNEDFAIGIQEIDMEHNEMVYHFEKLYRLMKEGKGHEFSKELLAFLNDYVHRHFGHEEALMAKIKYPHYEEHKEFHEEFKRKVAEIVEEYSGKSVTDADLIKINLFVKDWLIHHILMEDRKIGEFLKTNDSPI